MQQGIAHCMKRDMNEGVIPAILTGESENKFERCMKQLNNLLRKINNVGKNATMSYSRMESTYVNGNSNVPVTN